jgi:hypothetical protein
MDAQGLRLSGRIYRVTQSDSIGLNGSLVVLHEVSGPGGFAVDSTRTNRYGEYQFQVQSANTAADYYVSVGFQDIGYFSSALRVGEGGPLTVPSIVVYDTSYTTPSITLHERHIIVRHADVDGTRQIIELITLRNGGRLTRISADTGNPVWQGVLPGDAFQLALGESEVGTGAVYTRGDRLAVAAPIPPGEKQLLFSYMLPRNDTHLDLPVDQPINRLTISLEDTTAVAVGGGLVLYGTEVVGGTVFKRYDAGGLSAGSMLQVRYETALVTVARLQVFVVAAGVLALAGTLTWWWLVQRRRPRL